MRSQVFILLVLVASICISSAVAYSSSFYPVYALGGYQPLIPPQEFYSATSGGIFTRNETSPYYPFPLTLPAAFTGSSTIAPGPLYIYAASGNTLATFELQIDYSYETRNSYAVAAVFSVVPLFSYGDILDIQYFTTEATAEENVLFFFSNTSATEVEQFGFALYDLNSFPPSYEVLAETPSDLMLNGNSFAGAAFDPVKKVYYASLTESSTYRLLSYDYKAGKMSMSLLNLNNEFSYCFPRWRYDAFSGDIFALCSQPKQNGYFYYASVNVEQGTVKNVVTLNVSAGYYNKNSVDFVIDPVVGDTYFLFTTNYESDASFLVVYSTSSGYIEDWINIPSTVEYPPTSLAYIGGTVTALKTATTKKMANKK